MQQRKRRPQKVSDTCPKCGYCDKCGRANAAPVWPYPATIPVPYVPPTPVFPWQGPFTYTISDVSDPHTTFTSAN